MNYSYIQHLIDASTGVLEEQLRAALELDSFKGKGEGTINAIIWRGRELSSLYSDILSLVQRAKYLESKLTAAAEPAPLQDTTGASKGSQKPVTGPNEPIAVQAEPAQRTAPAPAPTPVKEVTPASAANGEKAEEKAAPKATPPASKTAEQTAPKAKGWVEKPKTDDKLNSASSENYADKSDADLDKERRLLCRDAVLKGAQPEAVRNFTIEKFGVRTVGAIPREKHGEWVSEFKKTFGV